MCRRLSCIVTAAMDNAGRAMMKSFCAQAAQPVNFVSPWMMLASVWWWKYFGERPWSYIHVGMWKREHVRVFTDAFGEDRIIVAFVVFRGMWKYT